MKLNPPDTAPCDGTMFLGRFVIREYLKYVVHEDDLLPTMWSIATCNFRAVANVKGLGRFSNQCFQICDLRGWLPMPQIDDQGNVT